MTTTTSTGTFTHFHNNHNHEQGHIIVLTKPFSFAKCLQND